MGEQLPGEPNPVSQRAWLRHGIVALVLALFVLLLYYPLLFTNQVLASGDALLYFYPYRDYVSAVLRAGQLPFWNPYLFAGAPLLANPQAAVLYPLHWPLIWLSVTAQVYWSAALHTWLLAMGGYALLRAWGASAWAGLVTALVLAGSGFVGGLLGHINQLNAVAWLPWAALFLVLPPPAVGESKPMSWWPRLVGHGIGFGLATALMLLAGHTQSAYINLFGLGLWCLVPVLTWLWGRFRARSRHPSVPVPVSVRLTVHTMAPLLIYSSGVLLALLLSAAQLLPTLELSQLGIRSSGLSYLDATSFSLKPWQLGWTLLPSYGLVSLQTIFDTPAYTEFVAYIGLTGILLAGYGAWRGRGPARTFGLLMVGLGLLLALGRWNPLYFVLHQVVPGFDLFRVPARWLMLYTLGAAVLAGLGWDVLRAAWENRAPLAPRPSPLALSALALLVALDLLLAARSLPHTRPTAPQAVYDLRTAPAHLLTDPARAALAPAAAGRFLGTSAITYDPGDMADYRHIFLEGSPPQLSEQAFADLVIAQKVQELLVPNLPLYWRIPAVDGFDGGTLPLERYNQLLSLFIPADLLQPDGRLREQLKGVPRTELLNLLNVQYVITDKVRDLWFEDVYYDRQLGAELHSEAPTTTVTVPAPFAATHVDLIAFVAAPTAIVAALPGGSTPVLQVTVASQAAGMQTFTVTAGSAAGAHLADGALDSATAQASGAPVAYRDVEGARQEYRVRLALTEPAVVQQLGLKLLDGNLPVTIQAASLLDARTGMFVPLLPSDRGRFQLAHSGDVKIYENLDLRPRAYLVPKATTAPDAATALAWLAAHVGVQDQVVVEGGSALTGTLAPGDRTEIVAYAPERVEIRVQSTGPAYVVLADSYYPGWTATVDGVPAPVVPANVLLRAVAVPAGEHAVVFTFQPTHWVLGLALSAVGSALVLCGLALAGWRQLRYTRGQSLRKREEERWA